jgi:signal transduction histidine kinase
MTFFKDNMSESKTTILYIADDVKSARLMKRVLTVKGYRFVHAANSMEGIRLADREMPDLVLTDIIPPDLNGLAVTTRLRNIMTMQHKPIVAITSQNQDDGRRLALACGCDGYITKPINTKSISAQIDSFLNGHQEKLSETDLVQKLESRVRELTEANQQLQETIREFQELDQQRAHFFDVVSHELRTPFTPIRGYMDLLASGAMGPLTPPQQQAVNVVNINLKNALRLLDDLLDLSKLKSSSISLSMEFFSVEELLDEITRVGKAFVENRAIDFETDITANLPLVYGDKGRIRQVILNFLNNAIKFTEEGSITLSAKVKQDMLIVSIKDTGKGMLPEEIPHVFKEFWQSKDAQGAGIGTGLGLAISKYLIEAHNGKIWLESEKGVGTTVSFIIPISKETHVKIEK